ncbi:MAG TPA: 2-phosphosulfolactate phosphatase [Rhizomicrobium sp.]|nr:2-phosphosulfolactate phosphatase [Rhizomicrobium sp.]
MPKLHVLFKKEELDPGRLQDKVVIVLDVLFATSTIVHAFSQGIRCIWPARDAEDALRIAAGLDAPLLAGEYLAAGLPGFGAPTPLALCEMQVADATLVYATTNGTVALNNAADAAQVYVGALLNGAALVAHVASRHPHANVLVDLTLRVPIFFAAAAANHIALYLPSPDLTIWEQEVLKDMRVQSPSNGSMWMKSGVWTCKVRRT